LPRQAPYYAGLTFSKRITATDWKAGHRESCLPFEDPAVTLSCKPTYGGYANGLNIDLFTRKLVGQPDGEGKQQEVIRNWEYEQMGRRRIKPSPKRIETTDAPMKLATSAPRGFLGKTITVKAVIPSALKAGAMSEQQLAAIASFGLDPTLVRTLVEEKPAELRGQSAVVIHDKTKRFSCTILPEGQQEEHARLEGVIREKGLMGLKAFFMAELESEDNLKIKIGDMLAVQAW
jgi:hypothetical protein